jgi:secreted trypsin-like serine protease
MTATNHGRRTAIAATLSLALCALLALLALTPPAGAMPVRQSIVGGSAAPAGSFPWLAFVADMSNGAADLCSGTVVSPNVVLTAGHCGEDLATGALRPAGNYRIVTGSLDWNDQSQGQVLGVARVIVYPGYNRRTGSGDAALLVLRTPTSAPPIRLASATDAGLFAAGTPGAIAGWGETAGGNTGSLTTALQWASTVVQSPSYCARNVPQFDAGMQLCAIDPPSFRSGTCFGDSGGPLIANYFKGHAGEPTEIGITSQGPASCATNLPNIYTRVASISAWARGWIGTLAPGTGSAPRPPASSPPASRPSSRHGGVTAAQAQRRVRTTLRRAFGRRFTRATQLTDRCKRTSASSFRCATTWSYGPDDYYGTVTLGFASRGSRIAWSDQYEIHWVSDQCYFHSADRSRCKVSLSRGG